MHTRHAAATAVTALLLLTGCQPARLVPGATMAHQVTYTVRCDACSVAYTDAQSAMRRHEMKGVWTTTVALQTNLTGSVMLTARPTRSTALVSHAYIEVDGKKVAEARHETRGMFSDEVTLTARLPGQRVGAAGH